MKMTTPKTEHFRFQNAVQSCINISLHGNVKLSFQVQN